MRFAAVLLLLALAAIADASRDGGLGLRNLLSDDPHDDRYKPGPYCKTDKDCKDYYKCEKLDKPHCEDKCDKDQYGKQNCYKDCWEHQCVYKPYYCTPHKTNKYDKDHKKDECEEKYGYGWHCKELKDKHCTYKDDCHKEKDGCHEYYYEDECHYRKGGCKTYDKKKECKKEKYCHEYHKEQKCDSKKVCKVYHKRQVCKKECDDYDYSGKCTHYDDKCHYTDDGCKEYEYKKVDCKYVPTKRCKEYKYKDTDCKYVNTHCKDYHQIKDCKKVQKGCKDYKYKNVCKKVEDKCWYGKCEKHEKPKPPPYSPPHSPPYSPPYKSPKGYSDR